MLFISIIQNIPKQFLSIIFFAKIQYCTIIRNISFHLDIVDKIVYNFVYSINTYVICKRTGGEKLKISEEIAEALRDDILSGVYHPRERLVEEELSEKFFVSRTPIREALRQLEAAGLVKIEPYKGTFVADADLEKIKDIYELRSVLDGFLVESVVPCITPETIRRMEALIEKQQQCLDNDDKSGFAEHDDAFHSLLYDCCPNAVAVRIARQLLTMTVAFRRLSRRTTTSMEGSLQGHRNILAAIKAGDAEKAAAYAKKHIRLYLKDNLPDPPRTSDREGGTDYEIW